ncbi:MAG: hypothetical protein LCI02_02755 [Proteobacteria bacterium]|nr:hypothetical protein [Pseudomonadota bacterium]
MMLAASREAIMSAGIAPADTDAVFLGHFNAWLFDTSGTTMRPNGLMQTQHSLMSMTLRDFADVDPDEILALARMLRGDSIMPGSWRNPEASGEAPQGCRLLTGDVGQPDAVGFVALKTRPSSTSCACVQRIACF